MIHARISPLFIFLAAIGFAILACSVVAQPTATPAPTATPTPPPTNTPAPTKTPAPPTRPPLPSQTPTPSPVPATATPGPGDAFYSTTFDDLQNWSWFSLPDTSAFKVEGRGGTLYVEVNKQNTNVYVVYDIDYGYSDIQIEADVETVAGPNRNNISLVCRASREGWYEFSMNSGGLWFIWRYDKNGYDLLSQGASTAINLQKSKNQLAAVCRGSNLTLYVNGEEIGSAKDTQLTAGYFGVSVSTFDISGAGVEFDRLAAGIPGREFAPLSGGGGPWPIIAADDFDGGASLWRGNTFDDAYASGTSRIVGGKFRWEITARQGFLRRDVADTGPVSDFYAAIDVQMVDGPTDSQYGITFRDDGQNYYLFSVSETSDFSLQAWHKGDWVVLIDWTRSSKIQIGQANRIAVKATGSHFVLYINGAQVGETDDVRLNQGAVGVAVSMANAGDKGTFEFDNFELSAP